MTSSFQYSEGLLAISEDGGEIILPAFGDMRISWKQSPMSTLSRALAGSKQLSRRFDRVRGKSVGCFRVVLER